jgi:GxxExxY protein
MESNVIYKDESYAIMGACFEVYKEKGCGFLEAVYQECLELELGIRAMPYVASVPLNLTYEGVQLRQSYIPDFVFRRLSSS